MRTICDACESAAAVLFCPADEAALCASCDEKVHELAVFFGYKVHMCNKLASRHVRLALANPGKVPKCELCDSAPAFFYCEVDGISLCLQCDMVAHAGAKRTHARFLILRQRFLFPVDSLLGFPVPHPQPMNQVLEIESGQNEPLKLMEEETQQNQSVSPVSVAGPSSDRRSRSDSRMIDLNRKPRQLAKNKKK